MLISLEMTTLYLGIDKNILYENSKYNKFIIRGTIKTEFDITSYNMSSIENRQNEIKFCADIFDFATFLLKRLGKNKFYSIIPIYKKQGFELGFERNKFTFGDSLIIRDLFKEYFKKYEMYGKNKLLPPEKRIPLTRNFIKENYWEKQKTTQEIADELSVPESWVLNEIKRLKLGKKRNKIAHKSGRKGITMSKEERQKRENQPHSKAIVQICPKSFSIINEFASIGAVERFNFNRENVRRAIKSGGLHRNYLWAFKGKEQTSIDMATSKGNLETKLQMSEYKRPSKRELKELYIDKNMTAEECAYIFKCHKTTISILAGKYGLTKQKEEFSLEELKRLYLVEKLSAKDIAIRFGYKTSSITTYLCNNNIKRREYQYKKGKDNNVLIEHSRVNQSSQY